MLMYEAARRVLGAATIVSLMVVGAWVGAHLDKEILGRILWGMLLVYVTSFVVWYRAFRRRRRYLVEEIGRSLRVDRWDGESDDAYWERLGEHIKMKQRQWS